jgi:hypothetical protein
MKFALIACVAACAAGPAAAQFAPPPGSYDGYYEYEAPVPPRPVGGYGYRPAETVVTTTTRRIVRREAVDDFVPAPRVVTRRVLAPVAEPFDDVTTGSIAPPPVRRVVKSEGFVGPVPAVRGEFIATRRVVAPAPVIVEERRVETTRRILRPTPGEWLD